MDQAYDDFASLRHAFPISTGLCRQRDSQIRQDSRLPHQLWKWRRLQEGSSSNQPLLVQASHSFQDAATVSTCASGVRLLDQID